MTDKALLMGVNNYKSISSLRGCENDVHNMARLLTESFGFCQANIRHYLSADVTKQIFTDGFTWLLDGAQAGDRLVLHFSGHGSYLQRSDDDEATDELICLYDMDFDDPETYLVDDDLGRWVARVPDGVRLTVILDSCHSGTGTRRLNTQRSTKRDESKSPLLIIKDTSKRSILGNNRKLQHQRERSTARPLENLAEYEQVLARFYPPDKELQERRSHGPVHKFGRSLSMGRSATLNHQLLAAAADIQTAADAYIDHNYCGAFTYYLCQATRDSNPQTTLQQVMDVAADAMGKAGFSQTPQNEGPFLDDPLFGPPMNLAADDEGHLEELPDSEQPARPDRTDSTPIEIASGVELVAQMLRVAEKFIDLADYTMHQTPDRGAQPPRVTHAATEVVVYVHGISRHVEDYSLAWWNALLPHLSRTLGRHEVLWSPVVNPRHVRSPARSLAEAKFAEELKMIVEDRQQQLLATASQARRTIAPPPVAALRGAGFSFDDFARYMYNDEVREEILGIFNHTVQPLLKEGASVHVISHSWGTVVAWEGLRQLDSASLSGRVANLFVVGSALSIGPVKSNLRNRVGNLNRPVCINCFSNLNAHGDVVGGPLDHQFGVDKEFLELDSLGCSTLDIGCAHNSYFQATNLNVNHDIFAKLING